MILLIPSCVLVPGTPFENPLKTANDSPNNWNKKAEKISTSNLFYLNMIDEIKIIQIFGEPLTNGK